MEGEFTFEKLLHEAEGLKVFRRFLETEFATENLDFWVRVNNFREEPDAEKRVTLFEEIYLEYIEDSSNRQINVPSKIMSPLHQLFSQFEACTNEQEKKMLITPNLYDEAQKSICRTMAADSYRRFIKTGDFKEVVPVSWNAAFSDLDTMFDERERGRKDGRKVKIQQKKNAPKAGGKAKKRAVSANPANRRNTTTLKPDQTVSQDSAPPGTTKGESNSNNNSSKNVAGFLEDDEVSKQTSTVSMDEDLDSEEYLDSDTIDSDPGQHMTECQLILGDSDCYTLFSDSLANDPKKQFTVSFLKELHLFVYSETHSQSTAASITKKFLDPSKAKDLKFDSKIIPRAVAALAPYASPSTATSSHSSTSVSPTTSSSSSLTASASVSSSLSGLSISSTGSYSPIFSTFWCTKNPEIMDVYKCVLDYVEAEIFPKFFQKYSVLSVRVPYRSIIEILTQWRELFLKPSLTAQDLMPYQDKLITLFADVIPLVQGGGGTMDRIPKMLKKNREECNILSNKTIIVCQIGYLLSKTLPTLRTTLFAVYHNSPEFSLYLVSFVNLILEILQAEKDQPVSIPMQPLPAKLRSKYFSRKTGAFLAISRETTMYWAGTLNRKNWRGQWKPRFCVVTTRAFLEFESMDSDRPSLELSYDQLFGVFIAREKRKHFLVLTSFYEKIVYQGLSYESVCGFVLALDALNGLFTQDIKDELGYRILGKTRFSDDVFRELMKAAVTAFQNSAENKAQTQSSRQSSISAPATT